MNLTPNEERFIKLHTMIVKLFASIDLFALFYMIVGFTGVSALFFLLAGPTIVIWKFAFTTFCSTSTIVGLVLFLASESDDRAKMTFIISAVASVCSVVAFYVGWGVVEVSTWF